MSTVMARNNQDAHRIPLEAALLLNGTFSGVCGFAFMMFAAPLSAWAGFSQYVGDWAIFAVGCMLAVYALLLFVIALLPAIPRVMVKAAVLSDAGWVVGTLPLLLLTDLTIAGRVLVVIVAIIVGGFGLMQYSALRAYRPANDHAFTDSLRGAGYGRIGRSWLSMKTWVKIWLFALNAIFIAGLAFWGRGHLAHWVVWVYIASGPYLFVIMAVQKGLSRVLGVAHIVPWTALLAYILLRLSVDGPLGTRIGPDNDPAFFAYLIVLWAALAFCLFFDYFDLYRWLRGERFLLGSKEAAESGASKATLT
jgi:hypothetical protein